MRDDIQFFGGIFLALFFTLGAFLLAVLGAYWIDSLWSMLWLAIWMPFAATCIVAFVLLWDEL